MFKRKIRRKLYLKYKALIEKNVKFKRCKNWKIISRYEHQKQKRFKNFLKKNNQKSSYKSSDIIKLGSVIDFEKNIKNIEMMSKNFEFATKKQNLSIKIHLDQIKEISINGLIYFLSYVDMLKSKVKKNLKYNDKYGINPDNEKLKYLFSRIGFWDYFGIKNPYKINRDTKTEYFLKIQTGIKAETKCVAELRTFMINVIPFIKNDTIQEYFEDALTEVMANSVEHAYIKDLPYREKGKWWLCGHYNKIENYLEFSFRDYGVGLRKTLEYNADEGIQTYMRKFAHRFEHDSIIIKLLVNEKIPKYKNQKNRMRGYGFKKFKEFANNIGYNCEMKILSGKGKYKYTYDTCTKTSKENLEKLDFDLGGFLISWKIYIGNEQ